MEIPAWLFFSFWALISTIFLNLSFHALDRTPLISNSLPPSPFILFLKHSLAISSFCSSTYALKYGPRAQHQLPTPYCLFIFYTILSTLLNTNTDGIFLRATLISFCAHLHYLLLHYKSLLTPFLPLVSRIMTCVAVFKYVSLLYYLRGDIAYVVCSFIQNGLSWLLDLTVTAFYSLHLLCTLPVFCIGVLWYSLFIFLRFSWHSLLFLLDLVMVLASGSGGAILMVLEMSLFFLSATNFSPVVVVLLSHLISASLRPFCEEGMLKKVKESKMRRLCEVVVGVLGVIFWQKVFLGFTSPSPSPYDVYLYLGVMWLANLTLLGFPVDLGIFHFILGNLVVVGWCSWAARAAALILLGLRLFLESLTFNYEEDDLIEIAIFSN